jgi:DNA primase
MGILDEDVARVRELSDIAAVIGEHVALKKAGRRLTGLCPFHSEKSPSFSVNPELNVYYCFGCQASGDVITFVREVEHVDFVGAVERLAARAGVELRYDERSQGESRSRRTRLVEAVAAAVDIYHRRLLEAPDAGVARSYLRSRGLDGDVVRRFAIGWAPDGWDELSRELQRRKFSREDVVEAGLAFVNRANKLQDQFRGRVMFPIHDVSGEPIGFGGRTLDEGGPKYTNSPETAIYQKRKVLYGLHWAKADAVAQREVVVCEGYTDVIAFHLAGAPRAVATCGTALADDHVRLLKRFATRLVLAYDSDAAGQAAAERFYRWESEFDLELAVAALGEGRDPADVWRDDPDLLLKALEEARPFLQFRVDRLLDRADRSTAEGRARAANGAIDLVGEHPDLLVRDQYAVQLSERLEIDADRLREAVERAHRTGGSGRAGEGTPEPPEVFDPGPAEEAPDSWDAHALRIAVQHAECIPSWLDASHLSSGVARRAFHALIESDTLAAAVERSGGEAAALLQRVAVEEIPAAGALDVYAAEVVASLVDRAARRRHRALIRAGDDRAADGARLLEALRSVRDPIDVGAAMPIAEQLVTWIASVGEG